MQFDPETGGHFEKLCVYADDGPDLPLVGA